MIVSYPARNEATMQKGTRHPNEELGGANVFPDKQDSVQTYPREGGAEHPDEARPRYTPPEVDASGTITPKNQWPVMQKNQEEYPRHGD